MLFSRANLHYRLSHVLKESKARAVKGFRRCAAGKQRKRAQQDQEVCAVLNNRGVAAADPGFDSLCAVREAPLKDQRRDVIESNHPPKETKGKTSIPGNGQENPAKSIKAGETGHLLAWLERLIQAMRLRRFKNKRASCQYYADKAADDDIYGAVPVDARTIRERIETLRKAATQKGPIVANI